jgi:cytoskeletal protein RodZ
MDENPRPKLSALFWVVSIAVLGALGALGWYAVNVIAALLSPAVR